MIDGATNATSTVAAGTSPAAVAVNPVTNKIYVANVNSANVTVIDGATNATSTVVGWPSPRAVAVNPVTNKIYVASGQGGVMVITPAPTNTNAMTTVISVGSASLTSGNLTLRFTADTSLEGTPTSSRMVYYQLDTMQGPWQLASGSAPSYNGTLSGVPLEHTCSMRSRWTAATPTQRRSAVL